MGMYILKRVGSTAAVLWLVSVGAFLLLRVFPGNPARLVAGPLASPEAVADLSARMGLEKPLFAKYFDWLSGLIHGDLGTSWYLHQSVSTLLSQKVPATIELALTAALLSVVCGVLVGSYAASRPGGWFDRVTGWLSMAGLGMPVFWLGLLLVLVFYSTAHLAPAPIGRLSSDVPAPPHVTGLFTIDSALAGQWHVFADAVAHLALPAITLAVPTGAYLARVTRDSVLAVYGGDYIRTARAKGASSARVLYRHALRNGLLPVITLAGLSVGDLLAGALLVEVVFSWPGLGGMAVQSVGAQDFAPVQALILLSAVVYCTVNLCADLAYLVVDPRVRRG